jgi:hypothetical protein
MKNDETLAATSLGLWRVLAITAIDALRQKGASKLICEYLGVLVDQVAEHWPTAQIASAEAARDAATLLTLEWMERAQRAEAYAQELEGHLHPRPEVDA